MADNPEIIEPEIMPPSTTSAGQIKFSQDTLKHPAFWMLLGAGMTMAFLLMNNHYSTRRKP